MPDSQPTQPKEEKIIILVDAYSTGFEYIKAFHEQDFNIIHIQSNPEKDKLGYFTSHQERAEKALKESDANITYNPTSEDPLEALITNIKERGYDPAHIQGVLAGTETGVHLTDELSSKLTTPSVSIPTNGKELSLARRNKLEMQKALQDKGVNSIPTLASNKLNTILDFANKHNLSDKNPIVIKPLDSAGSDNVYFCHNENEITSAFNLVLGQANVLNGTNEQVIAQPCIEGQEYMVNTVSYAGVTEVVEVHEIHKIHIKQDNGCETIAYDWERIIEPTSTGKDRETYNTLSNYAKKAVSALGIQYGPGHNEIILQNNGEPVLVETAARPGGSVEIPILHDVFGNGRSQPYVVAEAFDTPEKFKERVNNDVRPKRNGGGLYAIYLIAEQEYQLKQDVGNRFIEFGNKIADKNGTCLGQHPYLKLKGTQTVEKTKDLVNCPGILYFQCESDEAFKEIYKAFRQEEQGFFQVLQKPALEEPKKTNTFGLFHSSTTPTEPLSPVLKSLLVT